MHLLCFKKESWFLTGQKSSTVPNFYNTRLKHGNSSRSQASASASTSYLDKPQPTRTIPKPEGERFSRRVRGLDTDPVPSLEAVEKVYKSSRSGVSPSREDMANVNSKDDNDDDPVQSKREEQNEEGKEQSNCETKDNAKCSPLHKAETPVILSQEPKDGKGNTSVSALSTAGPSTSKKKRSACVWCRPRRKRRRLGLPKSGDKAEDAEKGEVRGSDEEDGEEVSMDDEEGEEDEDLKQQDLPEVGVDQQLAVDTSESRGN